jgi:hypothetical protein
MKSFDLSPVFFEALNYPEFARPNFYLIKQKESGWLKGVYLTGLAEVYHRCITRLRLQFSIKKRKADTQLQLEDIQIPVKEVTGGEEKGSFDKKILDGLFYAIQEAGQYEQPQETYSDIEVLSMTEYALWFIRNEFKVQLKEITGGFSRPRTDTYFIYHIAQDGPFFDYPKFKHSFRKLLLSATNVEGLKQILRPYHKAAVEIVKCWNEKVFKLEQNDHTDEKIKQPTVVNVQFKARELRYSWWSDTELFEIYSPRPYGNSAFASFAAGIANLLSNELLGGKKVELRTDEVNVIEDMVQGIRKLLQEDANAHCIDELKKKIRKEHLFRNWFSTWFDARRYGTSSEPIKGKGHIDLRLNHPEAGIKIIEFKGWWNKDKGQIIQQLYKYLTQFEGDAYIVMINYTRRDITPAYKKMVTTRQCGYIPGSWKQFKYRRTRFTYFRTMHNLGPQPKEVFHFIISPF